MSLTGQLREQGWGLESSFVLGLPGEQDVIDALSWALAPDPRAPGKLHARDVIEYDRDTGRTREADSIAHVDGTDDYSRFRLLDCQLRVRVTAAELLIAIPDELQRRAGRMSVDYFRYGPGASIAGHQDQFGDLVFIWVLARAGEGAESYLQTLDGRDVLRVPLAPGMVLAFRDDLFLHGVTPLAGSRDALIFIALKD